MSIIIKGLNLPPVSDTNGIINLSIDCYGQVVVSNTYPTKILKAEQIPMHGRLIDADAYEFSGDLTDCPTIIEAEVQ